MLQTCRPTGRLFYLVLAAAMAVSGVRLMAREVAAKSGEKPTSAREAKMRAAEPAANGVRPVPRAVRR